MGLLDKVKAQATGVATEMGQGRAAAKGQANDE